MALSKTGKTLLIIGSVIIGLMVLVIVFISPITKYLIEKYDEKYTGRQITMDWAYVNPFTGTVHFDDLKLYEYKSDSVFFSLDGIDVGISLIKLLSKEYVITHVTLNKPTIAIIQNKKQFNFDDLLEKFASKKDTAAPKDTVPLHLNVLDISVNDGEFRYVQKEIPVDYSIKEFDFESEGMYWDRDTIFGTYGFKPAVGSGAVKGDFTFNLVSQAFRVATKVDKFDLDIIQQYMKDFANYGRFAATLDADMRVIGNINDQENVNVKGFMGLNDFHFGKTKGEDYASFKRFAVNINDLSPKNKVYDIDTVMLQNFFARYEKYDSLDNIQRIFGAKGSNVKQAEAQKEEKFNLILEIADYVKVLSKNFLHSYYKLNKFAIYDADLQYNDFSTRDKFDIALNPFTVIADSIDKNKTVFKVSLNSGIKPYGNISTLISMNPQDSSDFDLHFKMEKVPAAMFNPFFVTYTSYPFDRGTLEATADWKVRNGVINSDNHFLFIDPRVTKRVKKKDTKWIPMPLIMAFIRERGNVIDYKVPITGNLKDPKFHLRDVIFDILKNIFVKPATTPYRFEVKNVEQQIEKTQNLKWRMKSKELLESQQDFVIRIAEFLKENPEASIMVEPVQYEEKEKEIIMLFEAKKKYYKEKNHLTALSENDSTNVEKLSTKDKGFLEYLDREVPDTMLFTVQKKSYKLIGDKLIQRKYDQLVQDRENEFMHYFKDNGTEARVKIKKDDTGIPYNGHSFYKINYNGDVPQELQEAYDELDELNNKNPRAKYKKERKKIFGII